MNIKHIQNYILDMAMGKIPKTPLNEVKIKGCKEMNFYVVNSRFEPAFKMVDVPLNSWKKKFEGVNQFLQTQKSPVSFYIVVLDKETEDNILYCCKAR